MDRGSKEDCGSPKGEFFVRLFRQVHLGLTTPFLHQRPVVLFRFNQHGNLASLPAYHPARHLARRTTTPLTRRLFSKWRRGRTVISNGSVHLLSD